MPTDTNSTAGGSGIFYGWVVVFAAFLAFGIVYGTVLYSFTVFVNPVAKAFDTSPTKVLIAFSLINVGQGVLGVFAGRLLIRHSIRIGTTGGLLVMAAGFLGLSMVRELWQFYLAYGIVIAFGAIIVAPLAASAAVANWFTASRGRALTIATLGTSFGQLVIPRVAAIVIEEHGWQSAYRMFAVLAVAATPILYLLVVDRPEQKGLEPYGGSPDAAGAGAAPALLSNREILRRLDFWTVAVSYALTVTVYLALVAVIVPYARTFGMTALDASKLTVCMGIFAIVGKLCFATWADRMGLRNTFWIAIGLNLVACALLVAVTDYRMLFVAGALAGASAGGVLPLWPGMIAFRFGRHALPQVMGLMSPVVLILQGAGAPLATALHFKPAYILFIAMLLASAFFSRTLNRATPG